MQFDVVIIGGGLAGLSCGIRLSEQGQRCAIVSNGQSALYFSSGSFDFLGQLPDGSAVTQPLEALDSLAKQAPHHPYSLLGKEAVTTYTQHATELLQRCGLALRGDIAHNHQRITPLGTRRTTWLSPEEIPIVAPGDNLPWKKIAVVGIEGFLDFQPEMVASTLEKEQGIQTVIANLSLPALDHLRKNPSEFRSANIARQLDRAENLPALTEELKRITTDAEAILLPACLGLENSAPLIALREAIGKPIMLLPTLPPSLLGMRQHQHLRQRFTQLGGMFMPGDSVQRAHSVQGHIQGIYTRNHGDIPLRAKHVVLASGSFFSNGLISSFDGIREPVFNLDIDATNERENWSDANVFSAQAYMQFGVKTDQQLHGLYQGIPIKNLHVIGGVLAGFDPLKQGCGAGVSLITAMHSAQQIMQSISAKGDEA